MSIARTSDDREVVMDTMHEGHRIDASWEKLAMPGVRIAFNAVPVLSPLTGVGQYTYRLIAEMQKLLACRPWLFYGTSWQQDIRSAAAPLTRLGHRALMRFAPNPQGISRLLKQVRFSMGVRGHSIDLYHEPAYLALRFRGPTVVTVHDISWIRHPETHPVERVRLMNKIMPRVIEQAAHIVVDSDFVRREVMSHYGVKPERVTTVHLGVAPEFFPLQTGHHVPVLERFGLRAGEYLLAVGTLEPRKNLSSVISAYLQLSCALRRKYPLVVVGMAGWGMEQLSSRLRQLVDSGEVRLLGYVPQESLPALYSGARMLVYPSLYEGFGLPPLEAMACGTPVIASRKASLPEVVGDVGLLVEPLDDLEIARHMRALIDDDELHARLGVNGRRRALGFTWRKFALEMLDVYRKVLD